jgi:hypothetical protein
MAIFDNEKQFYTKPAPAFAPDQALFYRFVYFVSDHVFVATIPISILAYFLTVHSKSTGLLFTLGALTGMYLALIGPPALVALLVAIPALLAWKKQRHQLFKLVFEVAFVFLYLLCVLGVLIVPLLP